MQDEINRARELVTDPWSIPYMTYLWVIFLSVWGGVVRVIRTHKLEGRTWRQILILFVSEMIVSSFVGVITYYLCMSAELKPMTTVVMISISAYMGGNSLTVFGAIYNAYKESIIKGTLK